MLHVAVSEVEDAIQDHARDIEARMPLRIEKLINLLHSDLMSGPIHVDKDMDPVHLQYSEFAPQVSYQDTEGESRVMGEDPEIDSYIEEIGMDPGEKYKADVPVPFDFSSAVSEVSDWMEENVHDVYVTEFGSLYLSEDELLKDERESAWEMALGQGLTRDEFEEEMDEGKWEIQLAYYQVDARDVIKEIVGGEVFQYL